MFICYDIFYFKTRRRIGVRIGDYVLDLEKIKLLFDGPIMSGKQSVFDSNYLNEFMALGTLAWKETRQYLKNILSVNSTVLKDNDELKAKALVPIQNCKMHLPAQIGDYTDFYSSKDHATNVNIIQVFKI